MDPTEEISAELQKRQTGANYIHSFDAYFLRQVITYCGEECSVFGRPANFALAHDSFAVGAGDAHTLLMSLSRAAAAVYGPDWIAIHADHWRIKPPAHDVMLSEGWSLGSLVE
jgi:DNA-directed RNA polymerase